MSGGMLKFDSKELELKGLYTLTKKPNGVWYFYHYDRSGKRICTSTGEKSKARAQAFCERKNLQKGMDGSASITFGTYFKDWWGPDCPYARESVRNGKKLSGSYVRGGAGANRNYIMPYFGRMSLSDVTRGKVERFKFALVEEKGLANKSALTYLDYLSVMLEYAARYEMIPDNPCRHIRRLSANSRTRGVLTVDEAGMLFDGPWLNPIAELANYTAMLTGMRLGEILALKAEDVHPGFIHVASSWSSKDGLGPTKTGVIRDVPIPKALHSRLSAFFQDDGQWVFTLDNIRPISRHCVVHSLRKRMEAIGISHELQVSRMLCFHSWRYFLNSQLRASGLPDAITKQVTGHATDAMMEHYTRLTAFDERKVVDAQDRLVGMM